MARNSDAVVLTCYAPLLARIGYAQWSPNLIWFDEKAVRRTPSYFVQQMFAENLGESNILLIDSEIPCQASYDSRRSELVLMLVNTSDRVKNIQLSFDAGWKIKKEAVTEILLTGGDFDTINTPDSETIKPADRQFCLSDSYDLPPYSFAVLRIPVNGIPNEMSESI